MIALTDQQINSIAQDLDCDMIVYVHRTKLEIEALPDFERVGGDEELWDELINKIEKNAGDYFKIEPLPAYESFKIMENFCDAIADRPLKIQLLTALEKKHPFRNFNAIIHSSYSREEWFAFKKSQLENYVRSILEIS